MHVLNCNPILQVRRNAGGPEGMAAGRLGPSGLPGASFDNSQHLQPMQPPLGQTAPAIQAAE
jgi:hypothetical protein